MKIITAIALLSNLLLAAALADNFSTAKFNGVTITSPAVTINNQTNVWPTPRPFIDTADLWSTDGWITGAWQTNSAIGDTVQVFFSLTSATGPWEPGSDPVVIESLETEFTCGVFFSEPYPSIPYQPIWLYLRGLRRNGDIAFSDVGVTYLQP